MPNRNATNFIEENCTIEHNRDFYSGSGSYLIRNEKTGLREGVVYLYTDTVIRKGQVTTRYTVGTWDGSLKTPATKLRTWKSNFGDTRSHFRFFWEGAEFWGINAGDTDIVWCKEYKGRRAR